MHKKTPGGEAGGFRCWEKLYNSKLLETLCLLAIFWIGELTHNMQIELF